MSLTTEALRVAVVGLGKMGLLHASILNTMPNVKLVATCEKSSFTRKLLSKILPGIPILEDASGFLDFDLDAVYVTTPISSHFNVARTIYQQKLASNLFVEKPLTSNYGESRTLCELAASNGGANMVGYLRRFMVTFMKAKDLLGQEAIGEPVTFDINAFSSDFCGAHGNQSSPVARAGVLRELGSYAIDLAIWFFGQFKVISAEVESLVGEDSEDAVRFSVQKDALQGAVSVSWCVEGYRMPEVVMSVKGSKGVLEVNDDQVRLSLNDGKRVVWLRHDLSDSVAFWLGAPEYYREDAYFVKSVAANSGAEPSFLTASRVDLLIEEIHRMVESRA